MRSWSWSRGAGVVLALILGVDAGPAAAAPAVSTACAPPAASTACAPPAASTAPAVVTSASATPAPRPAPAPRPYAPPTYAPPTYAPPTYAPPAAPAARPANGPPTYAPPTYAPAAAPAARPANGPYAPPTYAPPTYAPPTYPAPTYAPPPPPSPRRGSDAAGMMKTGFGLFAATYVITAIFGAVTYDGKLRCWDRHDPPRDCRWFGASMMIPLAGPWVAIAGTQSELRIVGVVWSGILQLAGLGMGIAGAVGYARGRRVTAEGLRLRRNLFVGTDARWGGAGLQLRARF